MPAPDAPTHDRGGAVALVVAGVLFAAYPALRPYGDLVPETAAAAFAAPSWLAAHLSAVFGFVLAGIGLAALARRERTGALRAAVGVWWVGAVLCATYYGAETFALHVLGARITDPAQLAVLAEALRMGPVQVAVFGAGLLLLAAAGVLVVVGLPRARAAALPFAAGAVLFLPQFYAAPGLRIAHGVLLGVGCVALAWLLLRPAGVSGDGRDAAVPARR
ncbi:hypothetical protein [Pseudonocardia sp.]|uniref:hypothetical protein n=1 Tax=Pseudonocardia sp. TaxID=60912 RepID=UPI003D100A15